MTVGAEKKTELRRLPKSQRGADTRERIVAGSISLFNRRGIQHVAIEHIAADLKMSPGNITYYFPLKRDLIHATLDFLRSRLREALESRKLVAAHDASEYVLHGMQTLWDFRFFFNALTFLLGDDQELRKNYFEFRDWAIGIVVEQLNQLVRAGYFRAPEAPNNLRLLADNMWAQWLNWLRMQQIENPRARTPLNDALYDCAVHLWSLCQPHLEPQFARQLLLEFGAFSSSLTEHEPMD